LPLFSFSIKSFQITDTRSAHKDTDYVSSTLKIGSEAPTSQFRPMGNLNNGTFNVNLNYEGVNLTPGTQVVFNYLIINAGNVKSDQVKTGLETLGARLANVPSFNIPPLVSSLELIATKFADELSPLISQPNIKSCDGLVAAEQNTFSYDDLLRESSQTGYITQATSHIGVKSPSGCNARPSAYVVNWNITQVVRVPSVINTFVGQASDPDSAMHILLNSNLNGQVDPKTKGSWVTNQNPKPDQLAVINSFVTLETITPP
jgi:hypothetical protein